MILACGKCKKVLTEDLYQAKVIWEKGMFFNHYVIKNTGTIYDKVGDPEFPDYKLKKGLFFVKRGKKAWSNYYDDDAPAQILKATRDSLVVAEGSIVEGVIPEFISGYGCCNYSMGEPLRCSCGHTLGKMHLDCYEDGVVYFVEKNVDRVY